MSYCINPHCPKPIDLANANNPICRNCGSQLLLQNRYRVLKQLGQGGFGNTFEIDDGGETKVLKVLTENNSKAVELFQQEAKVLSQLNSVGIPKVEADGYFTVLPKNSSVPLHCLVMEKIAGVNLEQWMEVRKYQTISEKEAVNWLKQIVEILALVHAQKYFHRDIKPQNIMLRPSGQLVLIDFGAVRQITTTILAGNSHTRIISQGYSPPEQQNGYSVQQSDFFALGRTFIFLLTGKEPQDKAIYDPLTNELHWRKYAVNISPLLADLIDNLIAPTANQRPENTKVILQRLKDIEQGLNQVHVFRNTTKIQSKNSVSPTVAVSSGKPAQTTAKPTQKSLILWPLVISSLLAPAIRSVLNQNNNQDVLKNVDTTPIISPSISNSSPVIPISKATPKAKPQIEPSPVNVVSSEDVEAEKARRKEIEKQKRLAVLKAEQERQAAREKQRQLQAAAKAEQERKAAKEAEKKREAERQERELEAAILAQLKEQAALQDKQRRQAAIQAEKAKQALRKKSQTTIVTVPKKRQSSTKGKVTRRKPENTQRANNNVVNTAKPWEITYPIPKASDELEQVIREGNQ
ncbi:serine/threonine protein kinase [Dolichospermum circinale]|uniref:serine/threonine protein kinase n=1 Tax=Dolichospermum circinale TaxID=109265 RepID=UPI00232A9D1F|nr:serine/threonine protein kinase [Dolichospermum circinale]MDB9455593.1 protein kinase [Dolichospermum circinale CS-541/06]MDB9461644.1 protein kinase [Dolichospermum circinale CS-541/04]MDB9547802.1 protein kinase [Dolichospermum circinale CS-1031]